MTSGAGDGQFKRDSPGLPFSILSILLYHCTVSRPISSWDQEASSSREHNPPEYPTPYAVNRPTWQSSTVCLPQISIVPWQHLPASFLLFPRRHPPVHLSAPAKVMSLSSALFFRPPQKSISGCLSSLNSSFSHCRRQLSPRLSPPGRGAGHYLPFGPSNGRPPPPLLNISPPPN